MIKKLSSLFAPSFDWIQVEVTSCCNAACLYCPRTVYRDLWRDHHLALETFKRLAPAFQKTRHVHLQGWGEPFLHPKLFEMVAMAKAAGCRVGTTTNGMLLNPKIIEQIIESGVDILAFSLAGTDERNDTIRKGTRMTKVIEAMRALNWEKRERKRKNPEIHVAYMLFRSGVPSLDRLPALLEDTGAEQVVISTLDFVPTHELRNEALIPKNKGEYQEMASLLDAVSEEGRKRRMAFHFYLGSPGDNGPVCTENVQRALCVAADGAVTPCVYTNLQISESPHFTCNESRPYVRMAFGNINERSIKEIWRKKEYAAFRRSFRSGRLAAPCRGCPKLGRF
jgi:MoaA/NifB/PqqE/SkfB family radical SAM enzyme